MPLLTGTVPDFLQAVASPTGPVTSRSPVLALAVPFEGAVRLVA